MRVRSTIVEAVSITQPVFVAVGIQHAMRMRHIVMLPALLYNIFPHFLINGTNLY
jgi:hypothetical protein